MSPLSRSKDLKTHQDGTKYMIKVALEDVHFKVAVVGRKLGPNAIQHHNAIVKRKRRSMSILASIQLATFNESC